MHLKSRLICSALVSVWASAAISTVSIAQPKQGSAAAQEPSKNTHGSAQHAPDSEKPLDGELVFQQHCSRCHTAPDGFSPHISGTIVRHMRVRASLSRREEEALLRFLNP